MLKSRLLAFVLKELREVLPPMVFFAVSFNLIVLTTDLILADYGASLGNFMVATMAALVWEKRCWWRTQCHSFAFLTTHP